MNRPLELSIDSRALQEALLKSPERLKRNMDRQIGRAVQEIAREARGLAPKASTELTNSIRVQRPGPFEGLVAPGVDYAQEVEKGTGIYGQAGEPSGKLPPIENLEDWIIVRHITPNDPTMSRRQLAWAMAQSIAASGTPKQEFMAPALENKAERAQQLLNQGVEDTLREMGG